MGLGETVEHGTGRKFDQGGRDDKHSHFRKENFQQQPCRIFLVYAQNSKTEKVWLASCPRPLLALTSFISEVALM